MLLIAVSFTTECVIRMLHRSVHIVTVLRNRDVPGSIPLPNSLYPDIFVLGDPQSFPKITG